MNCGCCNSYKINSSRFEDILENYIRNFDDNDFSFIVPELKEKQLHLKFRAGNPKVKAKKKLKVGFNCIFILLL